ncbi:MAG TPA: PDZ domain-containing protein, partial [Verrucomicrobiae bacterium]|nr:PDZ domain-containing protein [Verrucomicrobiae bacterium]
SQVVGFAVPVNLAREVMGRIVKYGKVTRGYLGVYIQDLNADLAAEFNVPDQNGALVSSVGSDTPAAKAGLKNGDVIVELDGKKVKDSSQLRFMVAQTMPDTRVTLKIIRDGKEKSVEATLGTLPDKARSSNENGYGQDNQPNNDLMDGVEVADLDSQARQEFNIPSRVRGALVTGVESGCPADDAGLHTGDVIVEINHHRVRDADDAVDLTNNLKGDRVLLRVWSRGENGRSGTHYLVVEESKDE